MVLSLISGMLDTDNRVSSYEGEKEESRPHYIYYSSCLLVYKAGSSSGNTVVAGETSGP